MAKQQNKASKADVQSTELNQFSNAVEANTEISAEEAATAFNQNQQAGNNIQNQE